MLDLPMKPPGTFKLLGHARRNAPNAMDPLALCDDRSDRIVNSLRIQILEGDAQGYQRTTLLDRDALEDLLATDDIRERVLNQLD